MELKLISKCNGYASGYYASEWHEIKLMSKEEYDNGVVFFNAVMDGKPHTFDSKNVVIKEVVK